MRHISIPTGQACEFINITKINPLISKCQIKVCYIGQNRNNTFISKEVAAELGQTLPGSPIVGFYIDAEKDFEEHNRVIDVSNGRFEIKDVTRPYGFVDLSAKVWFQKFVDDGAIEREYLVTEGYIWTGQYPESQRIVDQGNNHSMELDEESLAGEWSKGNNDSKSFFIINEAIISKLCILGENVEPCFEGSQITRVQFSLDDGIMQSMYSMVKELQKVLDEGGTTINMDNDKELTPEVDGVAPIEEPTGTEFVKKEEPEKKTEDKKENSNTPSSEDKTDDTEKKKKKDTGDAEEDEYACGTKKKKYNLEEVTEYQELLNKYNLLVEEKENLETEIVPLRTFKVEAEKEEKQQMIDSFYMLSDEDKKEVVDNITTYSLNDIEAKLAVICIRKKVNFNLDEDKEDDSGKPANTFNLNEIDQSDSTPAWIKAVNDYSKNKKI